MEDTLRVREYICKVTGECVLILVLMEDTLRALNSELTRQSLCVLILVLMEDTLRDAADFADYLRFPGS